MALLQTVMGKPISEWIVEFPILSDMIEKKETVWLNENALPFHEAIAQSELQAEDIRDASDRLKRFANYFKKVFPETAQNGGLIESPLHAADKMQNALEKKYGEKINGELLVKLDSHMPVSGSVLSQNHAK